MVEIIGVDHGFKNMKTASEVFPTALSHLAGRPDDMSGVILYKNEYYTIHGKPLESVNNHDKIQNQDFYILTLVALAKELKKRGKTSATVNLAAGLPQRWYIQQKNDFKKYLTQETIIKFEYEDVKYKVELNTVDLFAQGRAGALSKVYQPMFKDKYFVIVDIGGETVDIIPVNDGKVIESECRIDTHAMIWLLNDIKETVESEIMEPIHESVIQDYIKANRRDSKPQNDYEKIFQKRLKDYCSTIFTKLREFKINTEMVPLLFMGGGGEVINKYGTYGKNVDFVLDICANAKGYEAIETALLKQRNQK